MLGVWSKSGLDGRGQSDVVDSWVESEEDEGAGTVEKKEKGGSEEVNGRGRGRWGGRSHVLMAG